MKFLCSYRCIKSLFVPPNYNFKIQTFAFSSLPSLYQLSHIYHFCLFLPTAINMKSFLTTTVAFLLLSTALAHPVASIQGDQGEPRGPRDSKDGSTGAGLAKLVLGLVEWGQRGFKCPENNPKC